MEQARLFQAGQRVRIITCPHNLPEHTGQVGTVMMSGRNARFVRVSVGTGICQATEVAPVSDDQPEQVEEETTSS